MMRKRWKFFSGDISKTLRDIIIFREGDFSVEREEEIDQKLHQIPYLVFRYMLGKEIRRLTPGYFFGERALATENAHGRTASIISNTKCM